MKNKKISNITPFGLRMQPRLKERLEKSARKEMRSLNKEIVDRLELSFELARDLHSFTDGQLIQELIDRWGRDNVYIKLGGDS